MCEYVSVLATVDKSLQFYAEKDLTSHGNARLAWKSVPGINKMAEVEWTGENHDSLVVRNEMAEVAATIKQLIMDKFKNRAKFIASITKARTIEGVDVSLKNGQLVFTEQFGGPNYKQLNKFIAKLKTLPYGKPTAECTRKNLTRLVKEHLTALGRYKKLDTSFTLKIVKTKEEYRATYDAAKNEAYYAAYYAAYDAGRCAGHIASGLGNNPWMSLVEIMALGAFPAGLLKNNEFVVWVP